MRYTIHYYSEAVQTDIMALPATLQARYISLTDRMQAYGPNLGELVGRRVVMLHSFIKKSDKTPLAELRIAASRLKEVKNADSRADEGEDVG